MFCQTFLVKTKVVVGLSFSEQVANFDKSLWNVIQARFLSLPLLRIVPAELEFTETYDESADESFKKNTSVTHIPYTKSFTILIKVFTSSKDLSHFSSRVQHKQAMLR